MANSVDFRADQVQTNKIIVTGSTPQKTLLIYGIAADDTLAPNQGNIDTSVFDTSVIGSDVFLFVSGTAGGRGGIVPSITAFGGDLHVSGNLTVGGTYPSAGGSENFFFSKTSNVIETSGSLKLSGSLPLQATYMSASTGAEITGSFKVLGGITGSLSGTVGGYPFIVAGTNITASYNSLGQWEITGSAGGNDYFVSNTLDIVEASGSLYLSSSLHSSFLSSSNGARITGSVVQGTGGVAGTFAHAEGSNTTASGANSHAEGLSTKASGNSSHSEGYNTEASAPFSHAEGNGSNAYGYASHAEGWSTNAYGTGSLAVGLGTVASGAVDGTSPPSTTQAAFGKYNLENNTESLFVVGDGFNSSNRHDVLRVNSGSVQVTGSLIAPKITGSIQYINNSSTPLLVSGLGTTTNYNSLGQWEITGSVQKINIAGYNRTNLTSPTVIGLAYYNIFEYQNFSNISLSAVGMNMAGVSGGLDLYNQNTSTVVASLTWSGNSTLTTGSYQTTTFSIPSTPTSYELHFSQSGGANGGSDYSMVGFVNFVLS